MNFIRAKAICRHVALLTGIAASLAIAVSSPAEARHGHRGGHRIGAGGGYNPPFASIVVDAKTGKILEGENENAPRIPASITKVMTLYLLFEQIERGKVHLNDEFDVSANAAAQAPTKLGLKAGSTIEVEDAIKGIVTLSANDAAMVVAENVGGSEKAFADMMTRKAKALGMNSTVFYNPNGLPSSPPNITTAHDLAVLGRAIQDRFPKYFAYFQTRSFQFGSRTIHGHNRLMDEVEGVDGIKTGYTRLSGFNLLTSVNTGNRSLVAVILGGRSTAARDHQMASLIESYLPRAYAGARIAPPVVEGSQPRMVADASAHPAVDMDGPATDTPGSVKVSAATPQASTNPVPEARKPLDLNSLRPVVASATGASSTTTPSSPMRWQKGPAPLPQATQAYASLEANPAPAKIDPGPIPAAAAKAPSQATAPAKPATEPTRPTVTGWIIQLGATDDEGKAREMLDSAKSRSGKLLAKASAFTEKVSKDGSTLYRARFSGFSESDDAEKACKVLKRSGFSCFAMRS